MDPCKWSPGVCHIGIAITNMPKLFLHCKDCLFFQKILFSTTCWVLKEWPCNIHTICQKTLWKLVSRPWGLSHSIMIEKIGQILFFTGKIAFFRKFCLQQPLRCYRTDVVTSTEMVRVLFGPLKNVPWGLSHSILGEKIGKILFLREDCLFFQKVVFSTTS